MKFWPSEDLLFVTALEEEEVVHRMKTLLRGRNATYEGEITNDRFRLKRIISYRNSFVPVITGSVEGGAGETMLWVKMRLHTFVLAFLGLWVAGFLFASGTFLRFMITQNEFSFDRFVPLLMLTGVYAMTMFGFKFESRKVKRDFREIFQARMQEL